MAYITRAKTDDWSTPPDLKARLEQEHGGRYGFSLFDPCPIGGSGGLEWLWPLDDGLPVFVNPPYSKLKSTKKRGIGWIEKCRNEASRGRVVVALIPARTDTTWFHEHILPHAAVHFLRGRVKFGSRGTPAPFPSMVVVWPCGCKASGPYE